MNISDPLEQQLADALTQAGIEFIHESEKRSGGQRIDFFLPGHNVYIEVKRFHTDRSLNQLRDKDNIILIQGVEAMKFFIGNLKDRPGNHSRPCN